MRYLRYLPPLQALWAFEAAARHLSYSRAADELGLTHSSISHHIARIESELGVRLFVREGQRMLLTESGQRLVLGIRQGLQILQNAFADERVREKRESPRARALTVSTLPSFAARWLVPRLSHFQALYPDIDIAIRPSAELARLDGRDGADLAIRYGPGGWAGVNAETLLSSTIFPVCSPSYNGGKLPHVFEDLKQATLLRNPRQSWKTWFMAAGLDWEEPGRGPVYEDSALAVQAAIEGQGVALARAVLAEDDLAAGRLVRLFELAIEDNYAWYLVKPRRQLRDPLAVALFCDWLKHEVQKAGN
jgi:LysR family glycine cleavage system transcriptional activator